LHIPTRTVPERGGGYRDPDGNNIETVFHGPASKSADAIEITFKS
jgi:hypothetical protein